MAHRFLGRHVITQRQRLFRTGQYFQTHLAQDAECPKCPGLQTRYVVASNIFNDLSAEVESLALAVDQLDTEDHIPNGTVPGSGRSGQVARECSAQSGYAIEQWWLKRQRLSLGVKDRKNIDQWSAGPCRDNQLLRLVVHNTRVLGNVEHRKVTVAAYQMLLAAATPDADWCAGLACLL